MIEPSHIINSGLFAIQLLSDNENRVTFQLLEEKETRLIDISDVYCASWLRNLSQLIDDAQNRLEESDICSRFHNLFSTKSYWYEDVQTPIVIFGSMFAIEFGGNPREPVFFRILEAQFDDCIKFNPISEMYAATWLATIASLIDKVIDRLDEEDIEQKYCGDLKVYYWK
jgi:hypothetical protein